MIHTALTERYGLEVPFVSARNSQKPQCQDGSDQTFTYKLPMESFKPKRGVTLHSSRRLLLKLGAAGAVAAAGEVFGFGSKADAAEPNMDGPRSGPVGYTSFINPSVKINTRIFSIGAQSLIEGFVSLEGASARIGHASDLQDNCRLLNFGNSPGNLTIGDGSFTAHGVTFIGNVQVGSACGTVINAVLQNTTIGDASITGFMAQVLGNDPSRPIRIPEASLVLFGARIKEQSQVAANTIPIPAPFSLFASDVDQENVLLARSYNLLYRAAARISPFSSQAGDSRNPGVDFPDVKTAFGKLSVGPPTLDRRGTGVIPSRQASLGDSSFHVFQPLSLVPTVSTGSLEKEERNAPPADSPEAGARFIAPRVVSPEMIDDAILIGGVELASNVRVGKESYLHGGDAPAVSVGANTTIGRNSSVHELTFTSVRIGSRVVVGNRVVLHGPLAIGDNVSIGDGTVLFGPTVAENVKIGARVLAFGPMEITSDVPDDSILVPPGMEALIAPSHSGPRGTPLRSALMQKQWDSALEVGAGCACCSGILLQTLA
jgi:carbonic anhydrase/acetyltransferase-like protein (isoleucine patch superfamily)